MHVAACCVSVRMGALKPPVTRALCVLDMQKLKLASAQAPPPSVPAPEAMPTRPSSRRASKPTHASAPQPMADEAAQADVLVLEAPAQHEPEIATFGHEPAASSSADGWARGDSAAAPAGSGLDTAPLESSMQSRESIDNGQWQNQGDREQSRPPRTSADVLAPTLSARERQRPGSRHAERSASAVARSGSLAARTSHSPRVSADAPQPSEDLTPAHAVPTMPARPMTAKKAPPKAPAVDEPRAVQRSRLRPPDEAAVQQSGSRPSVHMYRASEQDDDEDDVDVVQETYVHRDEPAQSHGALVSDMFKVKQAAEQVTNTVGSTVDRELQIEGGVNLGRSQRKRRGGGAAKADLGQLRDAVEALVQGITPLARSMEHLQVRRPVAAEPVCPGVMYRALQHAVMTGTQVWLSSVTAHVCRRTRRTCRRSCRPGGAKLRFGRSASAAWNRTAAQRQLSRLRWTPLVTRWSRRRPASSC